MKATKDNATYISNAYTQGELETDWIKNDPTIEYTLPDEINIEATETTSTALVGYTPVVQGDAIKVYNATDGVVDGVVGTTTTTTGTTGTHDIFGDGSPVATYKLDGNANDLGGNYNGTPTNVTYGTGKFGQCAVFNGTNFMAVSSINNITSHSISFWFKLDSLTDADEQIISWGDGSYSIGITYNSTAGSTFDITATSYDGTNYVNNIGINFAKNTTDFFHCIAITNSNRAINSIFINGIQSTASSGNGRVRAQENGLYLGLRSGGLFGFSGSIDQVRIYNRALTSQEVTTLYNEQVTKYTSDITSLSLTNPPTKAWLDKALELSTCTESTEARCIAQDTSLTVTGTPTTTTASGIGENSGMLEIGDSVLLDDVEVTTSNVVESAVDASNTHDIFGDGSPVATYKLDGDATDLGGNYNGTATNVTYGTGKFGQAAVFNGSSSKVTLPAGLGFSSDRTRSVWIKTSSSSNSSIYYFGDLSVNRHYETLNINEGLSGILTFQERVSTTDGFTLSSTSVLNDNQWHNIQVVFSGSTRYLYIDGVLEDSGSNPNGTVNNSAYAGVFGTFRNSGIAYYNGSIDQVRIFNRALTSTEVTKLYNEQVGYQYDLTFPKQGQAPTTIAIPDRSKTSAYTDTWDGTKFTRAYNTISQTGKAMKFKVTGDTDVDVSKVTVQMKKAES